MRIQPKSEAEVEAGTLFKPGNYNFEIVKAEDAVSAAGNEMIKLTIKIFNEEGETNTTYDYLMEKIAYKLRHCCEACGLMGDYESGELLAWMFDGKTGIAKVKVDPASGAYPAKNSISDYLPSAPVHTTRAAPARRSAESQPRSMEDFDDVIPF